MARVGEVVEVEIVPGSFRDRSRIGENVAPRSVMQDHGEARRDRARNRAHQRYVDAALLQAIECDLSERVVADAGLKSDAAAECGQVVSHDRGGGAEREHHAVGEQFAFRRKLFGQAVEDEVEIQFAGDRDVETGHWNVSDQIV